MKKRAIDLKDYAGHIFNAIPKGVMITVKNEEKVNSMVIFWREPSRRTFSASAAASPAGILTR